MQSQLAGKKRPAPGSMPTAAPPMQTSANPSTTMNNLDDSDPSNLTNDQFLAWGSVPSGLPNDTLDQTSNANFPEWMVPQDEDATQQFNQLIRRNQNQELAAAGRQDESMDMWSPSDGIPLGPWNGDNGTLTEKADRAKREALSQRPPKSIPPFILKLSSFLDNNSNEELIRWSSAGDSFIVLDEDQFARKLIPELFKHDKYASFVRQLNMYGFHKKVALTDNSMRASERKSKSPSEYENPFFKRGRPELLWLIAKPGSSTKKKKKGQGDEESDEEETSVKLSEGTSGSKKLDLVTLPRSQLATFQTEIQQLQRQQQQINNMIARFQHENTQYIRQASERHERHENSINAILQFLATFYSRNADNSGNIPNMFGGNLPNHQPSGNVQEVNDLDEGEDQAANRSSRPLPRRQLLLPAPDVSGKVRSVTPEAAPSRPISSQDQQTSPRPSTDVDALKPKMPKSRQTPSALRTTFDPDEEPSQVPTPEASTPVMSNPTVPSTVEDPTPQQMHQSPPVKADRRPPANQPTPKPQLQSSNSDIMRLIHSSNAAAPNLNFDFPSALKNYENASPHGPLTPEQRNNVLSLMASGSGASTPMSNTLLTNATAAPPDYMQQLTNSHDQLDLLQKLQQEQDSRVQTLAGRLQPLSPHGLIPGLEGFDPANSAQLADNFSLNADGGSPSQNDNFDLGNWLNSDMVDDSGGGNADDGFGDGFHFDDANNNYFGSVNVDGSNAQATSGADVPKQSEALFNTSTNNNDLFGDYDVDADNGGVNNDGGLLFPEGLKPNAEAGDGDDSEGGKVIGSIGTSSAGRSPNLEAVEDEEEGGRRKRQRIS